MHSQLVGNLAKMPVLPRHHTSHIGCLELANGFPVGNTTTPHIAHEHTQTAS